MSPTCNLRAPSSSSLEICKAEPRELYPVPDLTEYIFVSHASSFVNYSIWKYSDIFVVGLGRINLMVMGLLLYNYIWKYNYISYFRICVGTTKPCAQTTAHRSTRRRRHRWPSCSSRCTPQSRASPLMDWMTSDPAWAPAWPTPLSGSSPRRPPRLLPPRPVRWPPASTLAARARRWREEIEIERVRWRKWDPLTCGSYYFFSFCLIDIWASHILFFFFSFHFFSPFISSGSNCHVNATLDEDIVKGATSAKTGVILPRDLVCIGFVSWVIHCIRFYSSRTNFRLKDKLSDLKYLFQLRIPLRPNHHGPHVSQIPHGISLLGLPQIYIFDLSYILTPQLLKVIFVDVACWQGPTGWVIMWGSHTSDSFLPYSSLSPIFPLAGDRTAEGR